MSISPLQGILVSHTHWDRAWYLPFEGYRLHLVRLIDQLLDLLHQDPQFHSFTLDGQTVVLEDYRQIRPERWPQIEGLVQAGRLHVGPFFVLPDAFLVSGEAMIRNLQRGMRFVQALGGFPPEGYMPDSFGHIAQMPQILRGFGLRSFLFMRGMSADLFEQAGGEFCWQGPDGSQVLALYLQGGYDNASALGHPERFGSFQGRSPRADLALERLREAVENLLPYSRSRVVLLCNGCDHMPPQPELPELIRTAEQAIPEVVWKHGTYAHAVDAVLACGVELSTYTGELLGNLHHPILSSVWSARTYLKVMNQRVQSLLEKGVEPLVAALGQEGIPFIAHLEEAWRQLLLCHPHDNICGCSIDSVHQDDVFHYRQVETIAETVLADCLQKLALKCGFTPEPAGEVIAVFNPHPYAVTQRVELPIFWTTDPQSPLDPCVSLVDPDAVEIPVQIQASNAGPFAARYLTYRWGTPLQIAFTATLPSTGIAFYQLRHGTKPPSRLQEKDDPVIENELYRISAQSNGSVEILHKPSGRRFVDALLFEDQGDQGDLYSFSPDGVPETSGQQQATIQSWQGLDHSRLSITITQWDRSKTESLTVTTKIELVKGSEQIQFETEVINQATQHRLRVLLPLGGVFTQSDASGAYHIQRRQKQQAIQPEEAPERYQGYPGELRYTTQFSQDTIHVQDQEYGILVAHRGLHEYELVEGQSLGISDQTFCALTLIRAVGILSRAGGRIRRVQAGPSLATPEGQCLGTHRFHYSWQVVDPNASASDLALQAMPFVHPLRAQQIWRAPYQPSDQTEEPSDPAHSPPQCFSLISIDNPNLSLSALKLTVDHRLIVRLWNRTSCPQSTDLKLLAPHWPTPVQAARCDLNEAAVELLDLKERTVGLQVDPHQIVTIAFVFEVPDWPT